jgi:hypothetical protein
MPSRVNSDGPTGRLGRGRAEDRNAFARGGGAGVDAAAEACLRSDCGHRHRGEEVWRVGRVEPSGRDVCDGAVEDVV